MAILITPDEVKNIVNTTLSSEIIQLYIDSVQSKLGDCAEKAYDESTAKLVELNLIAHQLYIAEDIKEVGTTRAPNGASTSKTSSARSGNGIMSTKYGRIVYDIDYKMCWKKAIRSSIFFGTVGKSNTDRKWG